MNTLSLCHQVIIFFILKIIFLLNHVKFIKGIDEKEGILD